MTIIERIKLNINIYCLNNDVEQVFVNFKNRRNAFTISFFFFFLQFNSKTVLAIESWCLQHLLLRLLRREARQ